MFTLILIFHLIDGPQWATRNVPVVVQQTVATEPQCAVMLDHMQKSLISRHGFVMSAGCYRVN